MGVQRIVVQRHPPFGVPFQRSDASIENGNQQARAVAQLHQRLLGRPEVREFPGTERYGVGAAAGTHRAEAGLDGAVVLQAPYALHPLPDHNQTGCFQPGNAFANRRDRLVKHVARLFGHGM
ncbi:hypothetical protein D3C73_1082930 [compost metagenome]